MSDVINKRRVPHPTIPGRVYIISHVYDHDRRPDDDGPPEKQYAGCTPEEIKRYARQDRRRFLKWQRDEWYYIGVCVDIRQQTATHWADGGLEVGRASLWGIESDSGEYIAEVEREMMAEADAEVQQLRAVIDTGYTREPLATLPDGRDPRDA